MNLYLVTASILCLSAATPDSTPRVAEGSPHAGVFLSAHDFGTETLTAAIDCSDKSSKVLAHDFFGGSQIEVITPQGRKSFSKSQVYGYRTCDMKTYRLMHNDPYEILDTAGFYIYSRYESVEINKGKGRVKQMEYYFSTRPDGNIYPLTKDQLKAQFPGNTAFHYSLDALFDSDAGLLAYDGQQKEYKIKFLYTESLKK